MCIRNVTLLCTRPVKSRAATVTPQRVSQRAIRNDAQHQASVKSASWMRKAKIDDITMSEFEITMTTMSDDDDYDSESGGAELTPHHVHDEVRPNEEMTIDLSGEDAVHNGKGEPRVEALAASSSPRAYQLEMLEESLRRNIIVAVSFVPQEAYTLVALCLTCSRWTLAAARRILSAGSISLFPCSLLILMIILLFKLLHAHYTFFGF